MCLQLSSKKTKLNKATKDIVCYKRLEVCRVTEINGEAPVLITVYQTIYQNFTVKIGETYTSSLEKINDTVEMGLHSYASIRDTQHSILGNEVIAKCIIPKGASYYKGRFEGYTSYASDTLTYVELI